MPEFEEAATIDPSTAPEQGVVNAGESGSGGGGSGDNPAWGVLRGKLSPVDYENIKADLSNWDSQAQARINSLTTKYKWASDLLENGTTPDQITQAIGIARRLSENPADIYASLGEYLKTNGMLPGAELPVDEDQPVDENADPRLAQLMQQQQAMQEFIQQQQEQQEVARATAELEQQVNQLKAAHPEYADEDIREVLARATLVANKTGTVPPLEDMAKDYEQNVRQRILSAPRPGAQAPRMIPTSGSIPLGSPNEVSLGKRSNQDIQNLVANVLSGGGQ